MQASLHRRPFVAAHTKPHTAQRLSSAVPARLSRRASVRTFAVLKVGDQLPDFELPTDSGDTIKSKDMVKDSGAVLFAYPKAATSGCTVQASGFRDNSATFESKGYKIYGISADAPAAQAAWKKEHNFGYPLLCDESLKVLQQLGIAQDGESITRSHIVVEKGGRISNLTIGISSKDSVPQALAAVQAE